MKNNFHRNQSIVHRCLLFAIFLATDGFRGEKIEYRSKQSNFRHPLKLSMYHT